MSKLGQYLSKVFFRYKFSAYDQYMDITKMPMNPRIVIFGPYNQLFNQVLDKQLKGFTRVPLDGLGVQTNNDDEIVESLAQTMTTIDPKFNTGYFIQDFPRTPIQAAKLDALLDGVNLAIYINLPKEVLSKLENNYLICKPCGQLFNTELDSTLPQQPGTVEKCNTPHVCNIVEIPVDLVKKEEEYLTTYKPVLDFYEKRGLLMNFVVEEKWSFQEAIDKLHDQVLANIKL